MLLKWYGAVAVLIASRRADALQHEGDERLASLWVQIAKAITDLERHSRSTSDKMH